MHVGDHIGAGVGGMKGAHEGLVVEPEGLVRGIGIERSLDQFEFCFQSSILESNETFQRFEVRTLVQHLKPSVVVCLLLVQEARDQFAAVVPGGEVGEVGPDHFGGVLEFCFNHAPSLATGCELAAFKGLGEHPSIAPAMEVAAVESEHLTGET